MSEAKPLTEGKVLLFLNRNWFKNRKVPKIEGKMKAGGVEYNIQLWECYGGVSKTPYYSGNVMELQQYIKQATEAKIAAQSGIIKRVNEENEKLLRDNGWVRKEEVEEQNKLEEARNCWKKEE